MATPEESIPLTSEERLKGLFFQYVKLYERWSEDRQVLNKHMADQAELLEAFREQFAQLKALAPAVRQHIVSSIHHAAGSVSEEIGKQVSEASTAEIDKTVRRLGEVVSHADNTLNHHQAVIQQHFLWQTTLVIGTAIVSSLLIVWLLMPKPTLMLTDTQAQYLTRGMIMSEIFPKLTPKEQKHIKDLTRQVLDKTSTGSRD